MSSADNVQFALSAVFWELCCQPQAGCCLQQRRTAADLMKGRASRSVKHLLRTGDKLALPGRSSAHTREGLDCEDSVQSRNLLRADREREWTTAGWMRPFNCGYFGEHCWISLLSFTDTCEGPLSFFSAYSLTDIAFVNWKETFFSRNDSSPWVHTPCPWTTLWVVAFVQIWSILFPCIFKHSVIYR